MKFIRMRLGLVAMTLASTLTLNCGAPPAKSLGGDIEVIMQHGIKAGNSSFDHSKWDQIIKKYASPDGKTFDYAELKKDQTSFNEYLESLANADLSKLPSKELQALLINGYNAYTIKTVLDNVRDNGKYEIKSIRDIPNVFIRVDHTIGGFALSLDNIEHNILRPMFKDPRFHFAVNCASVSCPPLPMYAFQGNSLEQELDMAARKALQDSAYVFIKGNELFVTKIFKWYGEDFVNDNYKRTTKNLTEFIKNYTTEDKAKEINSLGEKLSLQYLDYNWNLNKP